MGNYKSFIAVLLFACSGAVFAADTGEGYSQNTEIQNNRTAVGKAIGSSSYATSVNSTYDASNKDIVARYTGSATGSSGSKVGMAATVTKAVDTAAVASTIASRLEKAKAFGKASLPSFVGSLALQGLLDGIGWVMDKGGKIQKPADNSNICKIDGSDCQSVRYLYQYQNVVYSSQITACNLALPSNLRSTYVAADWPSNQQPYGTCRYKNLSNSSFTTVDSISVRVISNPSYSSTATATNTSVEVNTTELATKIAEQLNNPTYTTAEENNKKLIGAAYTADPTFDLSDDSVNKLSSAIGASVANALINAANSPTGKYSATAADGTKVDATVAAEPTTADGTSTDTKTTTDPDTGEETTTETGTGSKISLKFPAFCSWASIVCDWYDYTQKKYDEVATAVKDFIKEPDDTDTKLELDDENDDQQNPTFSFGGQCPPSIQLASGQIAGIDIDWKFEFTDFCTILSDYVRPILIAMGAFIAVLILGGVRTTDD